jgi:hypothetical protein
MKILPKPLRIVPVVFYVAALFVWIYTTWSGLGLIGPTDQYEALDPDRAEQFAAIVKSKPFVTGFIEAAYMFANGAMIHVLIAVYDKLKGPAE